MPQKPRIIPPPGYTLDTKPMSKIIPPPGYTLDSPNAGISKSENPPASPSTLGFLDNTLSSAGNLLSNVGSVIAHPIDTFSNLGKLTAGGIEKAAPDTFGTSDTGLFDAVINHMKERYGSLDNILKTAYEDPVGVAADASALVSGGGSVLRGVGSASKIASIARAGEIASDVGRAIDPIQATLRGVGYAGGKVLPTVTGFVSKADPEIIKQAFNVHSKTFEDAMLGKITPKQILDNLRDGMKQVADTREAEYSNSLSNVKGLINKTDTKDTLTQAFKEENVKAWNPPSKKGGKPTPINIDDLFDPSNRRAYLDYTSTAFRDDSQGMKAIDSTVEDLKKWKQVNAVGADRLRRGIYDRLESSNLPEGAVPQTKPAQAILSKTHNALMNTMDNSIPGYADAVGNYQSATKFLNELDSNLAGGSNGEAIQRLRNATKEGSEYQKMLVDTLDSVNGSNLRDQLSGLALTKATPTYSRALLPLLYGTFHGLSAPALAKMAGEVMLTSPKIVGKLSNVLGKGYRISSQFKPVLSAPFYIPAIKANQETPEIQ